MAGLRTIGSPHLILFSGFEIGVRIKCGLPIVRNPAIRHDPVKDVFSISIPLAAEDSAGRSSWDETAVLVGICGYAPWYTVTRGQMTVNTDGSDKWTDDAGGGHVAGAPGQTHLVESRPVGEVQALI